MPIPLTPDAKKEKQRKAKNSYLLRKYGITIEQQEEMIAYVNARCPICLCRPRKWAVDHDHFSGKVRGVLCLRCNEGLGNFAQDDVLILKRAIQYLLASFEGTHGKTDGVQHAEPTPVSDVQRTQTAY